MKNKKEKIRKNEIEEIKTIPEEKKKKQKDISENYMLEGMSMGIALGVTFGMLFNNLALGIAVGVAIGIAVGSTIKKEKK